MTNDELNRAFSIAQGGEELDDSSLDVFLGFGLPGFRPVVCTLQMVARLIRWQCQQFNGGWDAEALQEIARHGRHRFIIVGDDSADMVALAKALGV